MPNLLVLLTVLNPFITDGCTLFPDGTWDEPKLWEECCVEHDLHLWAGGTPAARIKADELLRTCVKEKGQSAVAEFMYYAVRLGSYSPLKMEGKEWGNAWEKPGYEKLTAEQVSLIKAELFKFSIPREMELRFIEMLDEDAK